MHACLDHTACNQKKTRKKIFLLLQVCKTIMRKKQSIPILTLGRGRSVENWREKDREGRMKNVGEEELRRSSCQFSRASIVPARSSLSGARAGGLSSAVVMGHLRCCFAAAMTVIASPPPAAASSPRAFSRTGCFYFLGFWLQSESGWSLLAGIVLEELRNLL